ncbi:polysaccharide pyruvyl transferase family protein [Microbacterium horticulturae]|uniref:Polysaccharide pyruvyl transferase family protein n=1 Tax=Microbacterium horticulturae TaxID=3028316 RepID=A0ABY8BZQ1_9MICO|nr:polysaccharide pyruvyl transferase family protein [Microbacterium sp. KACC 23027]WEG07893.1 polysaccharide pyruvyl transferase family protein [Microbacterium sp. KACC 23027]
MRRTLGVVGLLTNENVGDYLLVEASKYLLRSHDPDTLLVDIDVDPQTKGVRSGRRRINFRVAAIMKVFERPIRSILRDPRIAYYYNYAYWKIKLGWYFNERIRDLDAIVFTGGGFIKFKTQGLNYIDELILGAARKRDIPVMMNGVGVEGYSPTDIRCQRLKKALNSPNVKMITTRDDIDTLDNDYIINADIVTERVGDPVFWLNEMEMIDQSGRKGERSHQLIGINLLNPQNFSVYGGDLSPDGVVNFYRSLIAELQRLDAEFVLFSNGMKVDQQFGQSLVVSMNLRNDQLLHRPTSSAEFVNMIAGFDIILSARMHAGITAYAIDVPVVGLIWGEKLQFLTEITGLRDRYFAEDELDATKIAHLLVRNNLPSPDVERRAQLRDRTRHQLTRFVESVPRRQACSTS